MNKPEPPAQAAENEATLTGLPTGTQIKRRIFPVNSAGYVQPSKEISVVVP